MTERLRRLIGATRYARCVEQKNEGATVDLLAMPEGVSLTVALEAPGRTLEGRGLVPWLEVSAGALVPAIDNLLLDCREAW